MTPPGKRRKPDSMNLCLSSGTGILSVCFKNSGFRNAQARCLRHYRCENFRND